MSVSPSSRRARLASALAVASLSIGCASMFQSGNSSSSTDAPDYAGPVTVTNLSAQPICGVDLYHVDRTLEFKGERFADNPITTGASRTFDFSFSLRRVRLMACDGSTVLWDSIVPYRSDLGYYLYDAAGNVTLLDSGTQQLQGAETVLVAQNRPLSEYYGPQGSLHSSVSPGLLETVQQQTRSRFTTPVEWVTVSSNEYNIRRDGFGNITHRSFYTWIGFRGEDGECIAEYTEMTNQYDGSGYSAQSNVVRADGARAFIPCEVHNQISGGAPAPAARSTSPAAAPTGGRCENTCRTSNDNECDDGGPGSLYSICELGTDCNDCGTR